MLVNSLIFLSGSPIVAGRHPLGRETVDETARFFHRQMTLDPDKNWILQVHIEQLPVLED